MGTGRAWHARADDGAAQAWHAAVSCAYNQSLGERLPTFISTTVLCCMSALGLLGHLRDSKASYQNAPPDVMMHGHAKT